MASSSQREGRARSSRGKSEHSRLNIEQGMLAALKSRPAVVMVIMMGKFYYSVKSDGMFH